MARVFLYAPEDFHNLCLIARTLEAFGQRECALVAPHRLVRDRYGKARSRELRAVSAGAFQKIQWLRVDQPDAYLSSYPGRLVATVAEPDATALSEHEFEASDLILFGPEARGLPRAVIARTRVALTIPLSGETRSLNVTVAVGIVLFECQRQRHSRG
jgi:23S rRNA (guanosine2251-2'-O)-methyltransferase